MNFENWWRSFYDDNFAKVMAISDDTERIVDFVFKELGLEPGNRVYDQCCGNGRTAIPLAKRGCQVVGVDQASAYIDSAQRHNVPNATFVCGDAFEYVVPSPVDAVVNLWTSFGYSVDNQRNAQMLESAYRSLKPGGKLVLDYFNALDRVTNRHPGITRIASKAGPVTLIRESDVDLVMGVIRQIWTYILPDGRRVEHNSQVKILMPDILRGMFMDTGFEELEFFGDYHGAVLEPDSPRCIIIARRPLVE
jgi:SAM-dependent methyltransferase